MIDNDQTLASALDDPIFAENNLLYIRGIWQAGKDDVSVLCHFFWGWGALRTSDDQFVDGSLAAVVDGERETSFEKVTSHGFTHEAETDETETRDVCH